MTKRYATRAVTIDGKRYNTGDIVPNNVSDVKTAEKYTRVGATVVVKQARLDFSQPSRSRIPRTPRTPRVV